VQIVLCVFVLIVFACIGFLSPANRGWLLITLLLLFVLMGCAAGYANARIGKTHQAHARKGGTEFSSRDTVGTALFFPGLCFVTFFVLNLFVWAHGSANAVPFGSMVVVLLMWFGISTPLVMVGAYVGSQHGALSIPINVNKIARAVPPQPWYLHPVVVLLLAGLLPFGAVYCELYFILSSIWLNQYYYVFGFLMLVFVILALTCAEIAIVVCYFQLCTEDHGWAWNSFLAGSSSTIYIFCYSVMYFFSKMDAAMFATAVLYFGYMSLFSFAYFLMTGTIGYLSCVWFTRKIFGSIKVD
jgi:transmembrane 9 superfamily protein 2/4